MKKKRNTNDWLSRLFQVNPSRVGQKTLTGLKHFEDGLGALVGMILKIGTLLLIVILAVFVFHVFRDQGFVMEPFSVPAALTESGYDGAIVTRKVQDEVWELKELANSIKADSIKLVGDEQPELDLAVMGIGLSLRSVTYHLRELFGRKNQIVRGEITRLEDQYDLTVRMTGFPVAQHSVKVSAGEEQAGLEQIIRKAGEVILGNLDPYRLAVICYKEKRYDEAMTMISRILEERPREVQWAFVAWGAVLEEQNNYKAALEKYDQAIELAPDFDLAWTRKAWVLGRLGQVDQAIEAYRETLEINPYDAARWANLAWTYHYQKNYAKADSVYEQAGQFLSQEPEFWMSWADSKFSRGDVDAAKPLVAKAMSLAKGHKVGTYLIRGFYYLTEGDSTQALDNVMQALQLDPGNPVAISMGSNGSFKLGQYQTTIEVYRKADWSKIRKSERQRSWNQTAMAFNLQEQHDSAMHLIRKAILLDTLVGYPYTTLAETYAYTGRVDSFYFFLEKAFQQGTDPAIIDGSPPYDRFAREKRFQALLDQYRRK